jgi:RimJ/RimL family protein N-acetyltransferase
METRRLILRPFESEDAEAAYAWFGDPIVMRFTPAGPDTSIEQTKARLANYQVHQTEHGFSKWIVLDRHLGTVRLEIRDCSCFRKTVGSTWASASPNPIGERD